MAWAFFLNITNGTDRDLVVLIAKLDWGTWYTDSHDDKHPVTVPAGQTVQAVGVRSSSMVNGYEFSCTWKDKTPNEEHPYGTLNLYINVPFVGSNSSKVSSTGAFTIGNWEPLPSDGHNFTRSITITTPFQFDSNSRGVEAIEEDPQYERYMMEYLEANPHIDDWKTVEEKLKPVDNIYIDEVIPDRVNLMSSMVARTEPYEIERKKWVGIGDPQYRDPYAQKLGVKKYFTVAIYSISTNPRDWVSLIRKQTEKFTSSTEVQTEVANTLTLKATWSFKESLTERSSSPAVGMDVATDLTQEFTVENVLAVNTKRTETKVRETTLTAPEDSDMLVIPWVLSSAVIMYREDLRGRVTLISGGDWAIAQVFKSYVNKEDLYIEWYERKEPLKQSLDLKKGESRVIRTANDRLIISNLSQQKRGQVNVKIDESPIIAPQKVEVIRLSGTDITVKNVSPDSDVLLRVNY